MALLQRGQQALLLGRAQTGQRRWQALSGGAARNARVCHSNRSIRSRVLALDVEEPIVEADYAIVTVHMQMTVPDGVTLGEELRMVGSCQSLGRWQVESAPRMQQTFGGAYMLDINLPPGEHQFKVVVFNKRTKQVEEEEAVTRLLQVRADGVIRAVQVPEQPGWLRVDFQWGREDTITSFLPEPKDHVIGPSLDAAALEATLLSTAGVIGMDHALEDVDMDGKGKKGRGRSRSNTPTAYNIFIAEVIKRLKEEEPDLPSKDRMKKAIELWRAKKAASEAPRPATPVAGRSPSPLPRNPPAVTPSRGRPPTPKGAQAAPKAAKGSPKTSAVVEEPPALPPAALAALEAAKAAEAASKKRSPSAPKPTGAASENGAGSASSNGVVPGLANVANVFSRARLKSLTKGLGAAPPVLAPATGTVKAANTRPVVPAPAPGTEGAWKAWVGGVAVTGIAAAALIYQATTNSTSDRLKKYTPVRGNTPAPKPAVVVQQDEEEEEEVEAAQQQVVPEQQQPEPEPEQEPEPAPKAVMAQPQVEEEDEQQQVPAPVDEEEQPAAPQSLFERLFGGEEEQEESAAPSSRQQQQQQEEDEDPMAVLRGPSAADPSLPRSLDDIAEDAEPGSLYEAFFGSGEAEEEEEQAVSSGQMTLGMPEPSMDMPEPEAQEPEEQEAPSAFSSFFGGNSQPEEEEATPAAAEEEEEEDVSRPSFFFDQRQQEQPEEVLEAETPSLFQRLFGGSEEEEQQEQEQPAMVQEEEEGPFTYQYDEAPAQQEEEEQGQYAAQEEAEEEPMAAQTLEEEPSLFERLFSKQEAAEEEEAVEPEVEEQPPVGGFTAGSQAEADEEEPQAVQMLAPQQEEEEEAAPAVEEEEDNTPAWSPVAESMRQQDNAPKSFFESFFEQQQQPQEAQEPEVVAPRAEPASKPAAPKARDTAPRSFFESMFGDEEEEEVAAAVPASSQQPAPRTPAVAQPQPEEEESLSYFERMFRSEEAATRAREGRGRNPVSDLANASLFDELAGSNLPEEVAAPKGTTTITMDQLRQELGGEDLVSEFNQGSTEEVNGAATPSDLKSLLDDRAAAARLIRDFNATNIPPEDDAAVSEVDPSVLFSPKPSNMEVWDDCMRNSC